MTRPQGRDTKGVVLGKQQRSDDAVRVSVRYLKYTFIACAHALKICHFPSDQPLIMLFIRQTCPTSPAQTILPSDHWWSLWNAWTRAGNLRRMRIRQIVVNILRLPSVAKWVEMSSTFGKAIRISYWCLVW